MCCGLEGACIVRGVGELAGLGEGFLVLDYLAYRGSIIIKFRRYWRTHLDFTRLYFPAAQNRIADALSMCVFHRFLCCRV